MQPSGRQNMKSRVKKILLIAVWVIFLLVALFFFQTVKNIKQKDYGVFVGLEDSHMQKLADYKTVIIDADQYSQKEIATLHKEGKTVYTYLDIGSLETYRSYYKDFKACALAPYENWPDEYWMDVTNKNWQDFLIHKQVPKMMKKGVDGFFIDNCDVYSHYKNKNTYEALRTILKNIKKTKKKVIINGGDEFVTANLQHRDALQEIMDGENQESVYTAISYTKAQKPVLKKASTADTKYYTHFLQQVKKQGVQVYLTEYTDQFLLSAKIASQCKKNGWKFYIADSIKLN